MRETHMTNNETRSAYQPDVDDGALLALVRSEPEAFGMFYRRYERSVLGYFMRRTGDAEVAADLAAETFAAAFSAPDSKESNPSLNDRWLRAYQSRMGR